MNLYVSSAPDRASVRAQRTRRPAPAAWAPFIRMLVGALSLSLTLALAASLTCAQAPPPSTDGWVVLPISEYAALRHAAFPVEAEAAPPAVEATLSRLDYNLKVDGDLASGEARLTVDVIRDGWVWLPLPDGLMVREAKLDGREVNLVKQAGERGVVGAQLLLAKTGRSIVTLKIVAQVSTVAGTDILTLPVSNSAVSHAVVELTRQGVDVHISGGILLEHSDSTTGSRWVANGHGREPLTLAWRRKIDDQRASQPLRLRGTLTELVGLGEDTTQVNAEVQVEVVQGLAADVRVQLPDQFTVNQVSGATVADWDAKAGVLTVSFIEPVQDSTRFTVSGELRLPRAGKLDVPLMRLPTAERETGGVAVEVLGAGEIKNRSTNGLEEAEAGELGQLIASRQSPSLLAFRLQPAEGKSARALSLDVERYTPQAVLTANIEEADYSTLVTADGKLLVQSRFAVRNNQRNFLKLNLPATATLWSASVAGRPIRPGRAPDGSLLLPLEKNKSGDEAPAFVVEVSYLDHTPAWSDKGHFRLSLLAVDLPISKSHLILHHPPLYRLTAPTATTGSFRVAPYESPESAALTSAPAPQPAAAPSPPQSDANTDATQQLLSKLRDTKRGATPARNLPLRVAFPHFGPSIFLKSELTSENQTPAVDLDFQRGRKRDER